MNREVYRLVPKPGSMKNLKRIEEELPAPGSDEVTVEVKALGLNFADIPCIQGLYKAAPKVSFIPGLEYSGIVKSTGNAVTDYKEGDKVMGITRFGGYASLINIPHHYITKLPSSWTMEEGAAYLVHALTAYYALVTLADIRQGQTVLIHSAAGGVGTMANRIAKRFNAYTIGSIGNASKSEQLKKEGYDAFIVRTPAFREDLKKALGDRVLNIVLDPIGGEIFRDSFRILGYEGRMIVYGSASFMTHGDRPNYWKMIRKYFRRPLLDPMRLTQWNKSVMGFNLIYLYEQKENLKKYLSRLEELDLGKPGIGHVLPFSELVEGVRMLQSGNTTGKVVITVP
ncbi:MAG TPA: zinc-binding dehydrogenase [Cyclobacteriaceae bacterium]|nr:zinc-binding dehydrogenase [Cyclobacteriaceae bacterium]